MFQINDIVKPSGIGRTAQWGDMRGIITRVFENSVVVRWNGTAVEDEMHFNELVTIGSTPDDIEIIPCCDSIDYPEDEIDINEDRE